MAEASVKIRVATNEKMESYPVENGLLLLNKDSNSISFDWEGERKIYSASNTISVETEEELNAIENPLKGKLYYVEKSERFYKYSNGAWSTFDSNSDFISVEKLPETGEDGKYYIYENSIYRFDIDTGEFIPLVGTSAETEEKFDIIDAEILLLKKTVSDNNTTIEQLQQTVISNEKGVIANFF